MMRIGVATTMDDKAPSYHLRFRSVLNALSRQGNAAYYFTVRRTLFGRRTLSFEEGTDCLLVARVRDLHLLEKLFAHAGARNIPVIYETDDLILYERRRDTPVEQAEEVAAFLKRAACIIASTPCLADELKYLNGNIFEFPNLLDPEIWHMPDRIDVRGDGRITICCIGTGLMEENLSLIVPAMEQCERRYGRDVIFSLWGNARYLEGKVRKLKNVTIADKKMPYTSFARMLQHSAFDFGVVPLRDLRFNRAKSNIKYLEYAVSGIPAVFSRVEAYAGLSHGETCILAENDPDAWQEEINRMIEDRRLRNALADRAYQEVRGRFVLNDEWRKKYFSILEKAIDGRESA
jgi:glycosyltransferase involved in cell wall biosynthesis